MPDLIDPITIAIPFFVLLIVAELIYARQTGKAKFEPRDSGASLAMGLGNTVASIVFAGAGATWFAFISPYALFDFGWAWYVWIACFVLDDFVYYWSHRFAHTVRWFWADHVTHHSSQHYNLTTALRQPWFNVFTLKFIWFGSWMILLGFPPAMVAFCGGLNLIYQFWIHTEVIRKFPAPVEAVMNTPSHHRVHHATNPVYLDRNYAGVFIIWDRMFGTFQPELDEEPCRYGIVKNLGTYNPLRISIHEWWGIVKDVASARSIRHALAYVFAPPGWSPDGSRLTTKAIKKAAGVEKPVTQLPAKPPEATPAE